MTWHADTRTLQRYAAGTIDEPHAFSVEAHLVACEHCRRAVAARVDPTRLQSIWTDVVDAADRPRPHVLERILRRLGVRDTAARLLAATPSLQASWLLAMSAVLAFVVAASHAPGEDVRLFLVLAPLLPVAGVAAAYGPGVDPAFEIAISAPLSTFRLLLVRASAVLGVSLALAALASLALPALDWTAAAWVLPALALTTTSLALGTVVSVEVAAAGVAAAWVSVVFTAARLTEDRLGAFHAPGQLAFAALALAAAAVLIQRRNAIEIRSTV